MKKLFYILGIGLLMASCTEDFKDWADPQSNSEDSKTANAVMAAAGAIDFTTITADSVQIFVPTYNIEEGATATNTVTIFNADKSAGGNVNVDEFGRAKTTELRDVLEGLYGVPEEAINVPINVVTVLNANGQAFSFNSDIEDAVKMAAGMYLVQGDQRMAMDFVEAGKYSITVPSQEISFYFLPFNYLNNFEEGKLGSTIECDGLPFGGDLAQGPDSHIIFFEQDPDYTQFIITVNTNNMTYDIEGVAFADMIWQAGNANGWGNPAAGLKNKGWKDARNNDGDYYGFMYLNGEFKFRSQKDNWDAPDWGIGASEGTLAVQSGNLSAAEGFYMVEANLDNMTYNLTPITTIGVIGGFDGNSWGSDVAKLTYNTTTGAWEGYCDIPAGVEFKFRANDDWGTNWGGDMNNLSYDGGNLKLDTSANYFIQLYITYEGDFHVVMTATVN